MNATARHSRPERSPIAPAASDLFSLLYVSRMPVPDADEVDRICRQSQLNNKRDAVTGLLLFDGAAFCQLVEGPEAGLVALRRRLEQDRRHVDMRVLHFDRAPARRFPSWRLGYAFIADAAAIDTVQQAGSDRAVQAFEKTMASLAASPGGGVAP